MSAPRAAPRLAVEPATAGDDPAIRALLRDEPLGGAIRLSLEREPDARLAAAVEGAPHHTFVVRSDGQVAGLGARAVRSVWVNGEPARIGYLGLLRRRPELLGHVRLLADGFRACDATRREDELPYDLTSVVADNHAARRLLERGTTGLPVYRPLGTFCSLVIPVRSGARRARRRDTRARAATREDVPAVAACLERNGSRYQFAPRWDAGELLGTTRCRGLRPEDFLVVAAGARVTGCLARWDQRAFKQAVVRGYGEPLRRFRPLLDLALRVAGRPGLPPIGSVLPLAFIAHVAVDGDSPDVLIDLLAAACRASTGGGIGLLVLGLAATNPMREPVERAFRARSYRSVIYAVHRPGVHAEIDRLDGRPLHVEVATL